MTALDNWVRQATRHLSRGSAARVRAEILQHYDAAKDSAISSGATAEEADRTAMTALGDAKTVNCQYRNVLLTSDEAKMLGEGNWEAKAVCSRPWLKWVLLAIPPACLLAGTAFLLAGAITIARVLLVASVGTGVVLAAPFLPIYTPARARIFRLVKWSVLIGTFAVALGPDALKFSWLLTSCLWPLVWIEWTRVSIRRKLRVADWPKQLYL
jgi:hypothetical protein